jgi:hypothetical protein
MLLMTSDRAGADTPGQSTPALDSDTMFDLGAVPMEPVIGATDRESGRYRHTDPTP